MRNTQVIKNKDTRQPDTKRFPAMFLSDGSAVGSGYVLGALDRVDVDTVSSQTQAMSADPARELKRFEAAIRKVGDYFERSQSKIQVLPRVASEDISLLLEAHLSILNNSQFIRDARSFIKDQNISADVSINMALDIQKQRFEKIEDSYLAARITEVVDVAQHLLRHLSGDTVVSSLQQLPKGSIVICQSITLSDLVHMDPNVVTGIIVQHGTRQDHVAILARSMGMPIVSGLDVSCAVSVLNGQRLILDSEASEVIVDPDTGLYQKHLAKISQARIEKQHFVQAALKGRGFIRTIDGELVALEGAVTQLNDLSALRSQGVQNVGLFRTEYILFDRTDMPSLAEQRDLYTEMAQSIQGSLVVRLFDIGADKTLKWVKESHLGKDNSALGLRAVRLRQQYPEFWQNQIRALIEAARYGDIKILLPFVTSVSEFKECKASIQSIYSEFCEEYPLLDMPCPDIGVMVEIPSLALQAEELVKHADFISIGSNDLTQYTLATDRTNDLVTDWFDMCHPSVLRLMSMVIDAGLEASVPVTICGELTSHSETVNKMLALGARRFCVPPHAVSDIVSAVQNYHNPTAR